MALRRWLVPALVVGALLTYSARRRGDVQRLGENLRRFSFPSATLYDALASTLLGGFFARVARDVAGLARGARVLEVGSGPGRLAVTIAELEPEAHVTGVDVSPEMVDRANIVAARSVVAARVQFRVGDAAALPFPDASFDLVLSTFSLHHWSDPSSGLDEIYRVLRPGGVARIYDVVDWIRRFEHFGASTSETTSDRRFARGEAFTKTIAARIGPIPLVYRADLTRN